MNPTPQLPPDLKFQSELKAAVQLREPGVSQIVCRIRDDHRAAADQIDRRNIAEGWYHAFLQADYPTVQYESDCTFITRPAWTNERHPCQNFLVRPGGPDMFNGRDLMDVATQLVDTHDTRRKVWVFIQKTPRLPGKQEQTEPDNPLPN